MPRPTAGPLPSRKQSRRDAHGIMIAKRREGRKATKLSRVGRASMLARGRFLWLHAFATVLTMRALSDSENCTKRLVGSASRTPACERGAATGRSRLSLACGSGHISRAAPAPSRKLSWKWYSRYEGRFAINSRLIRADLTVGIRCSRVGGTARNFRRVCGRFSAEFLP